MALAGQNCLRVFAIAVKGCIDGGFAQWNRSVEARRSRDLVRNVAIRSGDHDLELLAPLTAVLRVVRSDRTTPEDALDVSGRFGVAATIRVGVHTRIALEIDVESTTALDGIALGCTSIGIVF